MTVALTVAPSPRIVECELTHLERAPIDYERALLQHAAYEATLVACGLNVRRLDVNQDYPDGVFIEDAAVVLDEIAVLCSMGAGSRRGEREAIADVLAEYRPLERIDPPALIDGGDVQRVGRTILVGLSGRSNEQGVQALRSVAQPFGYDVVALTVHGCLHLKSACTALPDSRLLVNREWIDAGPLSAFGLVDVPTSEPHGADVLTIADVVVSAAAFPRTASLLERCGYDVRTVDVSEFAKAEGAVTCMSLVFDA